jgi:hypothetical protein
MSTTLRLPTAKAPPVAAPEPADAYRIFRYSDHGQDVQFHLSIMRGVRVYWNALEERWYGTAIFKDNVMHLQFDSEADARAFADAVDDAVHENAVQGAQRRAAAREAAAE